MLSGETITLYAAGGSDVVRFVESIDRLATDMPDWVLIGGIAVVLRLRKEHRATIDVDALTRSSQRMVELLGLSASPRGAHRFVVPVDTPLDVMEVGLVPDPDEVPSDEYAFAVVRAWAFDTAERVRVEVTSPNGDMLASASMRIATPAALVALKSVSLPRRAKSANPAKLMSDTIDLFALIRDGHRALSVVLADAPAVVVDTVAATCRRVFVTDAPYTEAMLRKARQPADPVGFALAAAFCDELAR